MTIALRKPKDFFTGVFFIAVAGLVCYLSVGLDFGSSRRMGPGYFPIVLAGLLAILGMILAFRSLFGEHEAIETIALRSAFLVLGGPLLFALVLYPLGSFAAVLAMVLVTSIASPDYRPLGSLAVALVLSAGCALVFVTLLGQPIPLLGYWLR